jgi:hypothetical protein
MILGRESKIILLVAMRSWIPSRVREQVDTTQVTADEDMSDEMRLKIAVQCEELRCQGWRIRECRSVAPDSGASEDHLII